MNSEIIDYTDLRDSDSIPDFEEAILDEEEYDGQTYCQSEIVLDLPDRIICLIKLDVINR